MDVPATEPDEQELHPHRRQPQPHMVFEELLPLLVPPTEPQGLQQELATKLGNTIPP